MSGRIDRVRLWSWLVALPAGVLGGHILGYASAEPHASFREELLHATGHSYLPPAFAVAAVSAIAALAFAFACGICRARARPVRMTVAVLATMQTVSFILLEFGERAFAGVPVVSEPRSIAAGIAWQVVVAVAATFAIRLAERAGAEMSSAWSKRRRRVRTAEPSSVLRAHEEQRPRAARLRWAIARRGPPRPIAAS